MENSRRWSQQFDLYPMASGKAKENCKTKVFILLHFLDEEGIKIYNNFNFAVGEDGTAREDKNDLQTVLDKFKSYCNPRKNTVMERYTFRGIKQRDGETVHQFVNELKTKAKSCKFGNETNLMIRDRIIFFLIQDEHLKKKFSEKNENHI